MGGYSYLQYYILAERALREQSDVIVGFYLADDMMENACGLLDRPQWKAILAEFSTRPNCRQQRSAIDMAIAPSLRTGLASFMFSNSAAANIAFHHVWRGIFVRLFRWHQLAQARTRTSAHRISR